MNELLQRREPPALGSERGIGAYPLRDFQRIGGIELAIQIGMDQQDRVIVGGRGGHGFFPNIPKTILWGTVTSRFGPALPGPGRL
jgi:hypothetical protein